MTTTSPVTTKRPFNPQYKIVRVNKNDHTKGSASSWEYNPDTKCFFLTVAKQNKEKNTAGFNTFDWKGPGAETFKLEEIDIGAILNVFSGKTKYLGLSAGGDGTDKGKGLYHAVGANNAILKIYSIPGQLDFGLELSTKKNGQSFWGGHRIGSQEAIVLETILKEVLLRMYFNDSVLKQDS